MAAQPRDLTEPSHTNPGLEENNSEDYERESLLQKLRRDIQYDELAEHFLKSGRGRRSTMPSFAAPTKKLLLLLLCMKEDSGSSWDTVTSWFLKLFPEQDVTRGRLEHRVKTLLQQLTPHTNLTSIVNFTSLPEALHRIGLSKSCLMNGDVQTVDISSVTNEIVFAIETFRSQEGLTHAFTYNFMLLLYPNFTKSQMRHKVSKILKKVKELKGEERERYLKEPYSSYMESQPTQPVQLSKEICQCKKFQKGIKDFEEKMKVTTERNEALALQVEVLKEERDLLREERDKHKCPKVDTEELHRCKSQIKILKDQLDELKQLKMYRVNTALRKKLTKAEDQVAEKEKGTIEHRAIAKELEKKVSCLTIKIKSEQTLKSNYKNKYQEQKKIVDSLQSLLNSENENRTEDVSTREGKYNKFNPNMRLAIMQLQGEANVAASNCSKVIDIVASNIFGQSIQDLPSASCALSIADEAHHIAKVQVGEEIKHNDYFTFASDGTSRQKKHFMESHIYLKNGKVLSLGYSEVATDDAQTLLEKTMSILEEISETYCEVNEEDKQEMLKEILKKMQCMMSDRAANMKLFNKKISELKKEALGEDVTTHFLFCNAHFLLGLVSALEKALKEVEGDTGKLGRDKSDEFRRFAYVSESAAIRVIRTSAEVFGPRGDEKSGFRQDWLVHCETLNISSRFTSHRGNRFNNIFENAQAVVFHREHMLDFLKNKASTFNAKAKSILQDLEDDSLLAIVCSIAAFSSLMTSPYWKLMNSRTPYGAFPPYVRAMDDVLQEWTELTITVDCFDHMAIDAFKEFHHPDEVVKVFINSTPSVELLVKSFRAIAEKSRVVLRRQLADFLEGGMYGGKIPENELAILNTCPLTNLVGERLFGDLDFDMSKRRHASLHHRSTINMWKHNRTSHWFKLRTEKQKHKIFQAASKNASALREKHRQAGIEVRRQIKEKLIRNQQEKNKKAIDDKQRKASILSHIISSGGVIETKQQLDHIFETGTVEDLRAQIRYRKVFMNERNLKLAGTRKDLYNLLLEKINVNSLTPLECDAKRQKISKP